MHTELDASNFELEGLRTTAELEGLLPDCSANEAACRERAKTFVASICSQALASRSTRQECDSQKLPGNITPGPCYLPVFHNSEAPAPCLSCLDGMLDSTPTCSPSPEPLEFAPSQLVAEPSPPSSPRQLPLHLDCVFVPCAACAAEDMQSGVQPALSPCALKPEQTVQHVQPQEVPKASARASTSVDFPQAQPTASAAAARAAAAAATEATAEAAEAEASAPTVAGGAASASSGPRVQEHLSHHLFRPVKLQEQSPRQSKTDDRGPVTLQERSPQQSETSDQRATATRSNHSTGSRIERRIGSFFSTVTRCMSLKR